jgi:hypothetical protein
MQSIDFIVARDDLQQDKTIETQRPDADGLPADALLVKVDRFAFTANNITYAVLGDQLKYWQLFPAPQGFGIIPVWGFGEVIASKHPGIAEGERLFGYFPMATHLVIEASDVTRRGLRDAAIHRQGVAPVYNAYARISGDPAFAGRQGDHQALLRPLFMLSFLVDDYLAENDFFGGRVEDWRAGRPLDRATFPVPSTSHVACGFPALRAPICFTQSLWDLSCWGDFRPVASHSIGVERPSSVVQPPPIPSFPAEALSFLSTSPEPPGRFSLRLDV